VLDQPVRYLKGVGPRVAQNLARIGIATIEDLLFFAPRRYEDWRYPSPIAKVKVDDPQADDALVFGEVVDAKLNRASRQRSVFTAEIRDDSGRVEAVWFNQPFLVSSIQPGKKIYLRGRVERSKFHGRFELQVRDYLLQNGGKPSILPTYPLTQGVYEKRLRMWIESALEEFGKNLTEIIPPPIRTRLGLLDRTTALKQLHYPKTFEEGEFARRQFALEEFLILQLALLLRRSLFHTRVKGIAFEVSEELRQTFLNALPFSLTSGQTQALVEIEGDMGMPHPMNRLLQGDVGSGKTVIAAYGAYVAVRSGYQAAIMAPTEILVGQHRVSFEKFLSPHGISVVVLTRETKGKTEVLKALRSDEPVVVVGTHALIEENVQMGKLGFVVVDEQHRFGVAQRVKLAQKGKRPDLLVMTATPIPRTLTLTLYGDLDVSVIPDRPPGRPVVQTNAVTEEKRNGMFSFIKQKISKGHQVFVVCPLVEESEKLQLKAAEKYVKELRLIFPEIHIGLIHGRMKGADKDKAMSTFRSGEYQMLVATTVIEVGVDVPSASIMVIEHAERFGLSQLHQLRGRVGRGRREAYCFLLGDFKSGDARKRIGAMTKWSDGFQLSEVDLKLRGPGELEGTRQSGLGKFRFGDLLRDAKVLLEARKVAEEILSEDPYMRADENRELKKEILKKYGDTFQFGRLQ